MKNSNASIVIVFILLLVATLATAQTTTKTLVKTLPQADSIDMSSFMDMVEVIETTKEFAQLEVVVEVNTSEQVTNQLVRQGAFSVGYNQNEEALKVAPKKNEFYITVQGRDLDIKRSYKLYIPKGTKVNQRP